MNATDVLILMTRIPREGRNKTRLIPALGVAGATALHDRLARHSVDIARSYATSHPGLRLQIHIDGGSTAEAREWLGDADFYAQTDGDLGDRMSAAANRAFSEGATRVVVMGTDCPALDEPILENAYHALAAADFVFGPAVDGGYYLVGLRQPSPVIFTGIAWGGPQVLAQSLAAAQHSGFQTTLLTVLRDVDVPEDLASAEIALSARSHKFLAAAPTPDQARHISP